MGILKINILSHTLFLCTRKEDFPTLNRIILLEKWIFLYLFFVIFFASFKRILIKYNFLLLSDIMGRYFAFILQWTTNWTHINSISDVRRIMLFTPDVSLRRMVFFRLNRETDMSCILYFTISCEKRKNEDKNILC